MCIRDSLEDYLSAVEPPPQVKIAVQTYALARALVEAGAGLALVDPFTALGADPHLSLIHISWTWPWP